MKKIVNSLWSNELVRGSSIFYMGSMVVNLGGFVFHLLMSRMLGPVEYGILGSLFGLIYLVGIPSAAVDLMLTKVVSDFSESDRLSQSKLLLKRLSSKYAKYVLFMLLISFFVAYPVKNYLKIDNVVAIWLLWVVVIVSFITTMLNAVLKGLLKFLAVVTNQISVLALRILVSVIVVKLIFPGYLYAEIGLVVSTIIGLLIVLQQLSFFKKIKAATKLADVDYQKIGLSSFLISAAFTSMYSLDIVLVKHYFIDFQAGIYAVLATSGKIIFFATSPIYLALLPIIARKSANPSKARNDLYLILVFLIGVCGAILGSFYIFPGVIVNFIFTNKFADARNYLFIFGLAMSFYSIANTLTGFLVSLGKTEIYKISLLAVFSEIFMIFIFHDNLYEVVYTLIMVFGILATSLTIYSFYVTKKQGFFINSSTSIQRTEDHRENT